MRELLLAYLAFLREQALHAHEQSLALWACLAPFIKSKTAPPKKPSILEESKEDEHA